MLDLPAPGAGRGRFAALCGALLFFRSVVQMTSTRLRLAFFAAFLSAGAPALAAVYKCPHDDGPTTYQSMPCAAAQAGEALLGQSADAGPAEGDPEQPGLWEIATSLQPRVPAEGSRRVGGTAKADERPATAAPTRQLSCAERSPVKAWLSPLVAARCRNQIAARNGRCVVQDDKSDGRGGQASEVLVLAGNYRTELHVISQLSTRHADAEPVTDEARIDLIYRGECKPGMAPGDEFLAAPNGNWVKVR